MKVEQLLNGYTATKYFILDSHQNAMIEQEIGHQYNDSDYIGYGYNVHQFNQLVKGAFFLYRRPGKLSPDKKFHIYGGGIVESITAPDANGNVIANIKLGFKLDNSIDQGDPFLEEFEWKTRVKPGPGWKGFWTNYGMNEIVAEDFWGLIKDRTCELSESLSYGIQPVEEYEPVSYESIDKGFQIHVTNGHETLKEATGSNHSLVKKVDFIGLHKKKKNLGTAGELLVMEFENERLEKEGSTKRAEHVAETLGDGLGYEIRSYDKYGNEIHIEVKTTRANISDGFFMSQREKEEEKNTEHKYFVYRIYNYNEATKSANLTIYNHKDLEMLFDYKPVSYRVIRKS